jgi:GrpB-like predicted nucleotidyltransferase (UPF0157 family)
VALALGDEVVAIHHMGSTAVPGLAAKPIIDLLVAVHDIARLDALDEGMLARGYQPRGENGIPGRRYYVKGSEDVHTHHVHAFRHDDPQVARHLTLVAYLRAHPQEVMAYGRLKQSLARRYPRDIDAYVLGKDAYIKALDQRAAAWRAGQPASAEQAPVIQWPAPSPGDEPHGSNGHRPA